MGDTLKDKLKTAVSALVDEALRGKVEGHGLAIYGVEVSQATQYWDSASHRDNSIRLVAYKAAYVRVYVRFRGGPPLGGVTGTAAIQWPNTQFGVYNEALPRRNPASIWARDAPDNERDDRNASLNFLIPAAKVRGRLHLKIQVEVPGTQHRDEAELDVDASLLQTLRIRGIPVRYLPAGEGDEVAPPVLADFQQTAALAVQLFPVEATPDIRLAGVMETNVILSDFGLKPGRCSDSWIALLGVVKEARDLDGNQPGYIYYALLPANMPNTHLQNTGCESDVAGGRVGDQNAMAHELGHALGLGHAACSGMPTWPLVPPSLQGEVAIGPSGFDVNFPVAYPPFPAGSIGETGVDPTSDAVLSPMSTFDFMSYCGPQWISPYHYVKLLQHPALHPRWIPAARSSLAPPFYDKFFNPALPEPGPGPSPHATVPLTRLFRPEPEPLVVLTGVVRDDRLEVNSLLRLETRAVATGTQVLGTTVELLNEDGIVIGQTPLRQIEGRACGCGCGCTEQGGTTRLVYAYLPERDGIAAVRVVRDGSELWSRRAPQLVPEVGDLSAECEEDTLRVRWRAVASDEYPAHHVLRWSSDDGATWQLLATGLQESEASVPLAHLTSGVALVQALVSDGFYTAVSEPVHVTVPRRPPQVAILHPVQGGAVQTGSSVRLWGVATASDGRILADEALSWELDGHPAGTGAEAWADLSDLEGEHRAILRAADGGQTSETSVTFVATCSGRRPARLA